MDQAKAISDILESVQFLREHAASKEDLAELEKRVNTRFGTVETKIGSMETSIEKLATKEELQEVKDELLTHIDGLVVQHKKTEIEVVAALALHHRVVAYITGLARSVHYPVYSS